MNIKILNVLILSLSICVPFHVGAGGIAATPADQPIVPGQWHLSLAKALDMAQERGIPVLGFWSNTGCSRCTEVINQAINTPEFTAWRQQRQLLMVTGEGKTGVPGLLYTWVNDAATNDGNLSYPYIRLYWVQRDGTVRADHRFSAYPYRANAQTLINQIENYIATFSYQGRVRFGFTATPEMEPGTDWCALPLVREYGSVGLLTNTLSFTRTREAGGTTNWTETVVWADGEINRNIFVTNEEHYEGGTITVVLSAADEPDQTRVIDLVATQAITIHNPRYVGEPFSFGEWTMDLDAATNAVAQSAEESARTLVFFTGMWCPFCTGFEDDILQTEAFEEFARTNHLALVVISIPSRDGRYGGSPMTHNLFTNVTNAADRRIGLNGTSYMTRHGITPEAGWAQIQKILAFERQVTLPDKAFVNLPAVIMLRKDGTIASRIPGYYCYNYYLEGQIFPPFMRFPFESNFMRLHEQLAMTQDAAVFAHEESNNYDIWTDEVLGVRSPLNETLAANDERDIFLLEAIEGTQQRVLLTGPDPVSVSVTIHSNGVAVASGAGILTEGVNATVTIAQDTVYHVCVLTNDAAFSVTNVVSTLHAYRAETRVDLIVRERAASIRVASLTNATGVFETTLPVIAEECYRLATVGAQLTLPPGAFEAIPGTPDVYRALADNVVPLTLTADTPDGLFTWQLWRPGTVGFVQTAQAVSETADEVVVDIERVGGSSGACTIRITTDPLGTTATADEDFIDIFTPGLLVAWADGEMGIKRFALPLLDDLGYEGDETIALTLEVIEGGATPVEGRTTNVVTIIENDLPTIGRLMFTEAETLFAKTSPLTIIATEGTQIGLGVSRVEGASTAVRATVTATAGTVAPATLAWANNDREATKETFVTLPTLAECPRGIVTVRLVPEGAIRTVFNRQTVRVQLVAANAPAFASAQANFTAKTFVSFEQNVPVLQTMGGQLRVRRLSGRLPTGINTAIDKTTGALQLFGSTSSEGVFTAVYQVSERRELRWVPGGIVRVTITVTPLKAVNPATAQAISGAEGAVLDANTARVVGILTYTVSANGQASAQYRNKKGTARFSGTHWTACDEDGMVTALMTSGDYDLEVRLSAEGVLTAWVTDPDYAERLTATLSASPWSFRNPATDYKGYYTMVLSPDTTTGGLAPLGHSFMTLSMTSSSATRRGRFTYSGYLADGTRYSGSAILQPLGDDKAQILVFTSNTRSRYTLAGVFVIAAHASETYRAYPSALTALEGVVPYWTYADRYEETSFDITLDAFGGFYNSADNLLDYYNQYEGVGPMFLSAVEFIPESIVYGRATVLPFVELALGERTMRIAAGLPNPTRASLSFRKATGIFRGSMRLPFATPDTISTVRANYAGVLLPGWFGGECQTGCGDNEGELPPKPFGMGSYWYTDRVPVEGIAPPGMQRFKAGYPFVIEKTLE